MQRVISKNFWKEVAKEAKKAKRRQAAIAYVTANLIRFKKGDLLIVDASEHAIRFGETNAKLLQKLDKKGVKIYSCEDLHAKVMLFGDVAVVGTGNMSKSSETSLVEAGIITNQA